MKRERKASLMAVGVSVLICASCMGAGAKLETPTIERESEYRGEHLSLNFQDIPTRKVLQLIADFSGENLVVSDAVQGELTIRLKDVPWDQALEIILHSQDLEQHRRGAVTYIRPSE